MRRMLSSNKGFTLIELIVVIVILGIISLVAIPKVVSSIDDSKISTVKNNLDTVSKAINAYYAQNSMLPGDTGAVASVDNLLSGKTIASMGISYIHTAGAATYTLSLAASPTAAGSAVKLNASKVIVANFGAPLAVTSSASTTTTTATPLTGTTTGNFVELQGVTP